MFKSLMDDRPYLEEKYHKLDGEFEEKYLKHANVITHLQYGRLDFHGYEYDEKTGLSDEEIKAGLLEISKKYKDAPHPVAKARAIEYVLDNTRIDVNAHDYFIGIYSWSRLSSETTALKWEKELFEEIIPDINEEMKELHESGAVLIWPDFDHTVPDWDAVMNFGFPGLLERARVYRKKFEEAEEMDAEKQAYFDGIEIEYSAIVRFIDRLYQHACTQTHAKAEKVAQCLKSLRDGAPKDFYEALQIMYLYFMISESVDSFQVRSLGNGLDGTLYPFYLRDLENNTYTREEMKEFMAYFLMQFSGIGNYWGQPFYLGGTDEQGKTKFNDLSHDIIDTYRELGIFNPKVQIKVNYNTPPEFLKKVLDMVRNGQSSFVFCCEPALIKAAMSYGATYKEALLVDLRGCYEIGVRANEISPTTGYVNAAKIVLYVLYNGYDKAINKQVGLQTGELDTFVEFEDFYYAAIQQWENLIERSIKCSNAYEQYMGYVNPSSLFSATITHSLERGLDGFQNGMKFNNSSILNCGFASMVDAMMAVKEFVYDKKMITLQELRTALDANWSGYETLREKILNSNHKYGNGDEETDLYAAALSTWFVTKIIGRKNGRGGVYKVDFHAPRYVWQGQKTQATPDGRMDGDEISKNISPAVGMDKNGVTALIQSSVKLNPSLYQESATLDVMLHPSAVSGEEGLDVMYALVNTFMQLGGMGIQLNVFDTEKLKAAQKNPEKYKNLQVRVCGWNALWNNLSRAEQDAYICRAENIQ